MHNCGTTNRLIIKYIDAHEYVSIYLSIYIERRILYINNFVTENIVNKYTMQCTFAVYT